MHVKHTVPDKNLASKTNKKKDQILGVSIEGSPSVCYSVALYSYGGAELGSEILRKKGD